LILPTFNTLDYTLYTDNTIHAEEETINGLSSEKYQELTNEVLEILNEYRISQGLEPLKSSPLMMEMAQTRAKEQEQTGMSHYRPDGSSYSTIFNEYDLSYFSYGENVAYGRTSAEDTMNDWKSSAGHNANMLNSEFTHVGIGVTYYNGTYYWTQLFIGTTDSKVTNDEYLTTETTVDTTTENTVDITTEASVDTTTETIVDTTTETTVDTTTETSVDTTTNFITLEDGQRILLLLGDINCDNQIKSNDILMLKKCLLGLEELSTEAMNNADLSGDNSIKSNDLLQLKALLLGL